jgi:hypothetical protein
MVITSEAIRHMKTENSLNTHPFFEPRYHHHALLNIYRHKKNVVHFKALPVYST